MAEKTSKHLDISLGTPWRKFTEQPWKFYCSNHFLHRKLLPKEADPKPQSLQDHNYHTLAILWMKFRENQWSLYSALCCDTWRHQLPVRGNEQNTTSPPKFLISKLLRTSICWTLLLTFLCVCVCFWKCHLPKFIQECFPCKFPCLAAWGPGQYKPIS